MKIFIIAILLILYTFSFAGNNEAVIPKILEIVPQGDQDYKILDRLYELGVLKDNEMYKPGTILARRDFAALTVYSLVKVDNIKDFGIEYYITFSDLRNIVKLVYEYSPEIISLFPKKIDDIIDKVTRIEKRLQINVKVEK